MRRIARAAAAPANPASIRFTRWDTFIHIERADLCHRFGADAGNRWKGTSNRQADRRLAQAEALPPLMGGCLADANSKGAEKRPC